MSFVINICDPKNENSLQTITQTLDIKVQNNLSKYGKGGFCVSCKNPALLNPSRLQVKNTVTIYCKNYSSQDDESDGILFHGYIHSITQNKDSICIDLVDCIGRLKKRVITRDREFDENNTISADAMLLNVWNHLDIKELVPIRLWNIQINKQIIIGYKSGMSAYDVLLDIAERTGGEFRSRLEKNPNTWKVDCFLDFGVPEEPTPYGVGTLLDGKYEYNHQYTGMSQVTDREVTESLSDFCNINYSKDQNAAQTICEHRDEDSIDSCGVWECFTNNPDGQNELPRADISTIPSIKVDPRCTDRCDVSVWDRKRSIINTKYGAVYSFDAIILSINVWCRNWEVTISYDLWSSNEMWARPRNSSDVIEWLQRRLSKLERHA